MQSLGVEVLYRRDDEKPFEKGQQVIFDGFIVTEENTTDKEEFDGAQVCFVRRGLCCKCWFLSFLHGLSRTYRYAFVSPSLEIEFP